MKILLQSLVFNFSLIILVLGQDNYQKIAVSNDIEIIRISAHSYVHITYSEMQPFKRMASNGFIFVNKGKAFLFDSPANDSLTKNLVTWIQDSLKTQLVGFVPNHWHVDCMGGLNYLQSIGIESYANELTREIAKEKNLPVPDHSFKDSLLLDLEGEKISQVELQEEIFDVPIKKHVLHQVIQDQLMNKKLGTASTKGRSEVKGSRSKLWRQKGTGRARVGAASSPTRRGGGIAFGPVPYKVLHKTPRKVKKAAVRMALSDKFKSEKLIILNDFILPEIKTKGFIKVMENFKAGKALIVTEGMNENLERSSKNVPWAKVLRFQGLNTYDLVSHEYLFIVQAAIPKVEEALNP